MILSNDKANPAIRLDEKSNVETPLLGGARSPTGRRKTADKRLVLPLWRDDHHHCLLRRGGRGRSGTDRRLLDVRRAGQAPGRGRRLTVTRP